MRKTLCMLLTLLLSLLPLSGAMGELTRYKATFFDVFDTYSEIVVYAQDETTAQKILDGAHAELLSYHQLYDIYNDYDGVNNVKTINDNAGIAPVVVDQRIIDLITFGKEMEVISNGRKNIAMGSVLRIWHDYREAGIDDPTTAKLPDMAALEAAAKHADINNVIIDPTAKTVYLSDPEMSLDVGSIAKGFSVERVAQSMIASGVTSAILSIGGNVRAIGTRGDGTPWRVNIQNPDLTSDQALTTVDLENLSLVTSGSYQRYYTVDGKQYHHIIDPDTLMPAEYVRAVSVLTEDSGLGDALSMVLFNQSIENGKAFLKANYPGVEALWVTLDGQIVRTDGFSALAGEETTAQ